MPSGNDICRALVTQFALAYHPHSCNVARLNFDDSLTFLGEYGYEAHESRHGKTIPSAEWRRIPKIVEVIKTKPVGYNWFDDGKITVLSLKDRSAIQGFVTFRFLDPIHESDRAHYESQLKLFVLPLSLYFSFQNQMRDEISKQAEAAKISNKEGPIELTPRQIQVLTGMASGKTNHQMASELGYSVSTIRHETMAIYKELQVNDRHEAARFAAAKGLIMLSTTTIFTATFMTYCFDLLGA